MAVCCARFGLTKNRNRRRAEGFGLMLVISHTVCGPHPYTRTIHHPRQPPIRWIRGWVHVLANHDTNIKGSTSHKGTRICGARTSESVALPSGADDGKGGGLRRGRTDLPTTGGGAKVEAVGDSGRRRTRYFIPVVYVVWHGRLISQTSAKVSSRSKIF
ncbi:hypothetical protein OPV22_005228 [Ensete ventricosum]|uniref:Uncharacterized protein n=1 Tax=Ensete ventricosum TaxID=4639 RepID=A0AAV8Q0Q7_ENSVE|nr:hypothetical protein OPV22_005228 [Ensete ventricosum]